MYLDYDLPDDFYLISSEFYIKSKIFLDALQEQVVQTVIRETMRWSVKITRSRRARISSKARSLVEPSIKVNHLFSKMVEGLKLIDLYTIDAELFNIQSLDEIEWGDGNLCYHKVPPENKKFIMETIKRNLSILNEALKEHPKCIDTFLNDELILSSQNQQFVFFSDIIYDSLQEEQELSYQKTKKKK